MCGWRCLRRYVHRRGGGLLLRWPLRCWTLLRRGRLDQGCKAVAEEADIPLQALNFSAQLFCRVLVAAPDHKHNNCENNDKQDFHEND
jgi:hypothetical protein